MTLYADILVPLDGSGVARRSLGCATWLASRLGSRLHVLSVGEALPEGEAFERLRVPERYRHLVELHQVRGDASREILAAIDRHRIDLVVMSARGESSERAPAEPAQLVGHVTRDVIERSPTPVLVLPPAYEESLPWRSALVPLSGEADTDESLAVALRLAHALDLGVTVAHVAETEPEPGAGASGQYADAAYHEYPQMLNELVARACPLCTAEERRRIEDFRLCRGDVATELLRLIERERVSLLVVGWHGEFMVGHARVLKALMGRVRCPVLLVRPRAARPGRLKVGAEFG